MKIATKFYSWFMSVSTEQKLCFQDRLRTFFEGIGWKVYTVPETATILLGGGVKFAELSHKQAYEFQKDLLLTMLRIETASCTRLHFFVLFLVRRLFFQYRGYLVSLELYFQFFFFKLYSCFLKVQCSLKYIFQIFAFRFF